jgi:hypothetical protein
MTGMDDLVQWLRAQLDEDERIVRGADDSLGKMNLDWEYQPDDDLGGKVVSARGADLICDVTTGVGKHVAEYNPRRVLGEIDAKRRMLSSYETLVSEFNSSGPAMVAYDRLTGSVSALRHAVELLALPYVDRPGYREEWRP